MAKVENEDIKFLDEGNEYFPEEWTVTKEHTPLGVLGRIGDRDQRLEEVYKVITLQAQASNDHLWIPEERQRTLEALGIAFPSDVSLNRGTSCV